MYEERLKEQIRRAWLNDDMQQFVCIEDCKQQGKEEVV